MVGNHWDKKKSVMKAGKEQCSVTPSVHVLVKGKKGESPAPELTIMDGKGGKLFFF